MPPLGTAAYLAGLPNAAIDLGITTTAAQFTLTVYIVGMALGQLIFGPLSDRFGRRNPLLLSIAGFVLFSALISLAPNLEVMLVLRLLQGVMASAGMVLGRAIVHDIVQGDQAAKALNVITAAGLIVPALAPLLGSAVLGFANWRTIFIVLAVLGAVIGVWAFLRIPESLVRTGRGTTARPGLRARATPAFQRSMPRFAALTAIIALSFMAMYAYISSAPFVFQQLHGFTPAGYAITGAVLSLIMAGVGIGGSRLIGRKTTLGTLTPQYAVTGGLAVMVTGAAFVFVTVFLEAGVAWYIGALAVATAPVALVSGSASALAMDASPLPGGSSSAIIGFTQSLFGAATPPLVGLLGVDARPMALVFLAGSLIALVTALWTMRVAKRTPSLRIESRVSQRRTAGLGRGAGTLD